MILSSSFSVLLVNDVLRLDDLERINDLPEPVDYSLSECVKFLNLGPVKICENDCSRSAASAFVPFLKNSLRVFRIS
ncbi:hypothetical protein [Allobaculum mucilyticum]|uniref:hypothetical protein n=2 Tax=Allobaculum mucilyticum TaxID=2834459 RepID=UPI001F6065F6|nr:hypothetical protein [Allobaculum mucilyticum]UNT95331.1 hypothetical protein KWG62_08225 [Allobaculum mucilyticum]